MNELRVLLTDRSRGAVVREAIEKWLKAERRRQGLQHLPITGAVP